MCREPYTPYLNLLFNKQGKEQVQTTNLYQRVTKVIVVRKSVEVKIRVGSSPTFRTTVTRQIVTRLTKIACAEIEQRLLTNSR